MLRGFVLALSGLGASAGGGLIVAGDTGAGISLLCVGAAIVLGTLLERWRYRSAPRSGACWERTGERFEDPGTGETMEVEYDRAGGERRYVHSGGSPNAGRRP